MKIRIMFLLFLLLGVFMLFGCTEEEHEFGTEVVVSEATCVHSGEVKRECINCGYIETVVTPPLGHEYSKWYVISEPTCIDAGSCARSCTRCSGRFQEDIPATGHDYDDWTVIVEASCEREGTNRRMCNTCHAIEYQTIEQKSHDFLKWETVKEATCSDDGTDMRECKYCGFEESRIVAATGIHDYTDWNYIIQPDCETDGLRQRECLDCKKQETEILYAKGHECESWIQVSLPDCTEAGSETGICLSCGESVTRDIPPLGHQTGEYVVIEEADCNNNGLEGKYCSRCEQYVDLFTIISPGHQYGEWVIDKEVSCYDDGLRHRTCSVCAHVDEEIILSANAHQFGEWSIDEPSTCLQHGHRSRVCSLCLYEETEELPLLEHDFGEWSIQTSPTLTTDGSRTRQCSECSYVDNDRIPATANMPQIYIVGNYEDATKRNEVTVEVVYYGENGEEFSCYATIKVQGGTSVGFPKKNYTIKFYTDDTLDDKYKVDLGWGNESKYCMKANWVDCTHARNIVSCRLWGQGVRTRPSGNITDRLSALETNGGAVDGYPIMVYMNGSYYGLYTMNVPKDEWMFDMGKSETEAIIATNGWNTKFDSPIMNEFVLDGNGDYISGDWEIKYFGTEDTTGDYTWVRASFNELINFVIDNDGDSFREGISQYLDVDSTIDYIIYLYAFFMRDNAAKNMLWSTYDGKIWFPTVYDQDGTFGVSWDGKTVAPPQNALPVIESGTLKTNIGNENILWRKMMLAFPEKFYSRYLELRSDILSMDNVKAQFDSFVGEIPEGIYDIEREKNPTIPSWNKFEYDYIINWYKLRLIYMDSAMETVFSALIESNE